MKVKLKKGYDMPLAEAPVDMTIHEIRPRVCRIYPDDYPGFAAKPMVKEGDRVDCGDALLYNRDSEDVKICSPLAGKVTAVSRGERRKLLYIEVRADEPVMPVATKRNAEAGVMEALCARGFLAQIRQRPYDIVPDPAVKPRDIFVTAVDSAPLATGLCMAPVCDAESAMAGLKALASLTEGKVYLSVKEDFELDGKDAGAITGSCGAANVEAVIFEGPHPVGNAGIQAANIRPVNKGETIWTLDIRSLCRIGKYIGAGIYDPRTVVAVAGSEVTAPCMMLTLDGAEVKPMLADDLKNDGRHQRIISGNVLTGVKIDIDGCLHFPWRQLTVIPEGDDVDEFLGWASLSPKKMSAGRTFPFSVFTRKFTPDARILGGRRAMILSGVYDRMIPMDIYPEYLLRAIIGKDIDQMEKLGIYEVAPEDFALAEYADPSKMPLQQIVREGLDYLRKENS